MGFIIYLFGIFATLALCTLINRNYRLSCPDPLFPLSFAICVSFISWTGVLVVVVILLNHVYSASIISKYQNYCEGKKWYVKAYNYFIGKDIRNKNVIYVEPENKKDE